jgi:hypothetical protein
MVDLQCLHPVIASGLAGVRAAADGLTGTAVTALKESWKAQATNWFNLGGLIGTLLTVPAQRSWAAARCSRSTSWCRARRSCWHLVQRFGPRRT